MDLSKLFYPKTIALIGASSKPGSIGYSLFQNLSNFELYPINPKLTTISDTKCFANIADIPIIVDLAIVAVHAAVVPIVVEEIAQKGVKNIIVISSGFKEAGRADLEDLVKLICQKNNINLLGPNCLGLINTDNSLNASFATQIPKAGNISFLSQSGAICTAVVDLASKYNLGFSKFISLGNKTILNENDFLTYLENDPNTKVIAMYTEQLFSPSSLFGLTKPVIVLKSGKTEVGARASKSHTGALAGNDSAYDALFIQSGAIRADDISDYVNFQSIFSTSTQTESNTITIVTNAGGVGVLAADEADKNNLKVDKIDDLLGDALSADYESSLNSATSDNLLVILTPQSVTEIAKTTDVLINFKNQTKKLLVVCYLGDVSVADSILRLRQNGVCVIDYPESAVRAIAAVAKYSAVRNRPANVAFESSEEVVLPKLNSYLAKSVDDAIQFSSTVTYPVALKISSPGILHKSDVGGVVLDVDPINIKTEYLKLVEHIKTIVPLVKIDGVLIEEMVDRSAGLELIIGAIKDPSLGQTIMIGAGGIYTEIIKDVAFGIVPITKTDALNMISKLKIKKILDGARGGAVLDVEALVDLLGNVSQYLMSHPEIIELDINPVLVLPKGQGVKILDSRIIKQ